MPRKPVVYLVVVLPLLFGGGLASVVLILRAFSASRHVSRTAIPDASGLLIALPTFFLWIPIALLLSNLIIYLIPSLHRTAEQYVAETGRPAFLESQRVLIKTAVLMALVCVPLIALGFWL